MIPRLREWCLRVWATVTNRQDDVDEELRFHLEMAEETALRRGASVREARLQARGFVQPSDAVHDQTGIAWLADFFGDSRHALRNLAKSPQFASAAIASLALGMGANTAIFSVVNAAFLRPLRYSAPERLAWVTTFYPKSNHPMVMMPDYAAWKRQNSVFQELAAYQSARGKNLSAPNYPAARIQVARVTPEFFAMLGVQPRLGRNFQPNESEPVRNTVALISDSLWRGHLRASPDVVGMTIFLDGAPYTVIGVLPPQFVYPEADEAALWLPNVVDAAGSVPSHSLRNVFVIGRLKRGVTLDQAHDDLQVISQRLDSQFPEPFFSLRERASVRVVPLQDQLIAGSRTAIYVLMGAAGCILLIVCANVANLFLARSAAREREIAIRAAIGASRSRVVRLLLAESVMLSAAGGLLGIFTAWSAASALSFLLPGTIQNVISIDPRVLAFAVACAAGCVVLVGMAPALTASRLDLSSALKDGGTHLLRWSNRSRLRGSLAIAQLALCLVLLVGAGLLMRTFVNLLSVNPGFDPHNVLLADISLEPESLYGPARQTAFFGRALVSVQSVPGVKFAALASATPLAGFTFIASVRTAAGPGKGEQVGVTAASPAYFSALGVPLLAGRAFAESDRDGSPRVAIISQEFARLLFHDADPIGRKILEESPPGRPIKFDAAGKVQFGDDNWLTIVGVVGDIRHQGLDEKIWPELFQPYAQAPLNPMSLVVRGHSDPASLGPAIRRAVQAVDPNQPVFGVETMDERLSNTLAQRRQRAWLLTAFAFLSVAVAMIGVYGVMAYSVKRRTHEIGIRIAIGAQRGDVLTMVVGEGLAMALIGVAIGVVLSLALTRVLTAFLFGVGPRDMATFAAVCISLVVASCLASYVPARRATRVDPIRALRHE
jgi:predicted permease